MGHDSTQDHLETLAICGIVKARFIRKRAFASGRHQASIPPHRMRLARTTDMGLGAIGLGQHALAQPPTQPRGHREQSPRRTRDISVQDRSHPGQAATAQLANKPGPYRPETCATSIRAVALSPSSACCDAE